MKTVPAITLFALCIVVAVAPFQQSAAQEFPNLPPLTPAELQLKDNAKQPGVPAMILYYAVDTDNTKSAETHSIRIKIFAEEGKKYADVEIPYLEKYSQVEEIQGRTVAADGKVTPFTEQVFDREIVKAKKFRYHAKVLTLPNVQAGSVIEYTYRIHYKEKVPDQYQHPAQYIFERGFTFPAAEWIVQRNLYLKHGHFTLLPVKGARVDEFRVGLPTDTLVKRSADGKLQFDVDDIPGYEEEEFSPPEENLKGRINLYYAAGFYGTESYWIRLASKWSEEYEAFIGLKKSKQIANEVARLLAPGDTDEAKLRKIYARAQLIRAMDYQEQKTEKELKREHLKDNKNAEEVLERGYGYGYDINLLFIAMARAAGFQAYPFMVSSRRRAFFMKDYPNYEQLDAMVAVVQGEKGLFYLDPGSPYCPFDLLPWGMTNAAGIMTSPANSKLASTPPPGSKDAVTRTEGALKLTEDGTLQGTLRVSYLGQEALTRRNWAIGEDDTRRREYLEETVKKSLTAGATVKLLTVDGWEKSAEPLRAEFEIEVPNYATITGRRLVLTLGVLHTMQKNPFPTTRRTQPIYFDYPYESYEDIKIELPPGMQVESPPVNKKVDQSAVTYELTAKTEGNTLQISRSRRVGAFYIAAAQYPSLRMYFNQVQGGDSLQVTLRKTEVAATSKP